MSERTFDCYFCGGEVTAQQVDVMRRWKGRYILVENVLTTCPFFANECSDSSYGRVIYTYPEENHRLHTLIPRDSHLWQCHEDARSCAERSTERKKYDFHLLQTRTAGRDRWFFRVMLAAMCQHIDAWQIHAADRLD